MDTGNMLENKIDMYPTCGAHILTGKAGFNKYDRKGQSAAGLRNISEEVTQISTQKFSDIRKVAEIYTLIDNLGKVKIRQTKIRAFNILWHE